jgi:histone acetyltransferase (RNA polymerase elongator complex component)
MKYQLLTKEQFEELHVEFASFLASQQIDKKQWEEIKEKNPEAAGEEMEIFSDLIWERVLENVSYLEHYSEKSLNLFKCNDENIERIVVKVEKEKFNFLEKDDFNWFMDHTNDASVTFLRGKKVYSSAKNTEIFDLIRKGSIISKGELFEAVLKILENR